MARKKRYSKWVFANIRVSSVKKRGGVDYLKRYVKEKQLSVKEILDETSGKLIEESIKVSKAELIKTNTTLETLKHNFDNFEHEFPLHLAVFPCMSLSSFSILV
jgi:chromosome condensin MukBEF complex kleisin-like MukF subunit